MLPTGGHELAAVLFCMASHFESLMGSEVWFIIEIPCSSHGVLMFSHYDKIPVRNNPRVGGFILTHRIRRCRGSLQLCGCVWWPEFAMLHSYFSQKTAFGPELEVVSPLKFTPY